MADEGNRSATSVVVIVAIVGLISTLGAAALTGYWADRNLARNFELQNYAKSVDQRRDIYVNYNKSRTNVCQVVIDEFGSGPPRSEKQALDKVNAALVDLINLNVQIQLFARTPEMQEIARDMTNIMVNTPIKDYDKVCDNNLFLESQSRFVKAATTDLEE